MGELTATAAASTDSPHSSPSSTQQRLFVYSSEEGPGVPNPEGMGPHTSPQPPHLVEEVEGDEDDDPESSSICSAFYRSSESASRKAREFIPESKKDEKYWERRRKNNEAAKRSREKRRQNDALMEQEIAALKMKNEALMRENAALIGENAALKAAAAAILPKKLKEAEVVVAAVENPLGVLPGGLDLLAVQKLLSALANGNSNNINALTASADGVAKVTSGLVDETPLDLSGAKLAMKKARQINNGSTTTSTNGYVNQPVFPTDQMGKLSELAVLTSTTPPNTIDGGGGGGGGGLSSNNNRPQSCSWNSTPNPVTPPSCSGLQALISAASLNTAPTGSETINLVESSLPPWDSQPNPMQCLPLGLQPMPPQTRIESSGDSNRRRSSSIRSPAASQYDDERYRERRRRNNEAVRRCRENKRARLSMRDEVTGRLQSDNMLLRSQLDGLNSEVKALRNLLLSGQQQSQHQLPNQQPPSQPNHNQQQEVAPPAVSIKPEPRDNMVTASTFAVPVQDCASAELRPIPRYALPKKGIPRVAPPAGALMNAIGNGTALPPLKRRITLPPTYNPLGAATAVAGSNGIAN